jgi:hypothetical protein
MNIPKSPRDSMEICGKLQKKLILLGLAIHLSWRGFKKMCRFSDPPVEPFSRGG